MNHLTKFILATFTFAFAANINAQAQTAIVGESGLFNGNTQQIAQKWNQYFSAVNEEIRDCVKVGMDLSQLKYQILADPAVTLTSPQDPKLKPIYEKCESFAKQNQPKKGVPCTLAGQNNLKTTCDGVYAERQPDGRLKSISRAAAIQLQFEGKPWTVGVLENLDVRAARLKQEEEDKSKQAAEIAAKKEADEKERLFKLTPEYKKQQAALEIKRIGEEKEAARKQAEAERIRIADEKQASLKAKKDLEDQEREAKLKAQKDKLAADAQRAEEEKLRQKLSSSRVKGNFKCSNSAMVDEISGRETYLKGNEVWSISLNGSSGILISPTGKRELLTYQSSVSGPKSSGDIYSFNNTELFVSLQLMIDNGTSGSGKGSLITKMKPVANMKILMIGFCN